LLLHQRRWRGAIFAVGTIVLAAIYDKASSLVEISFGPLKAKLERNVSDAEHLLEKLKRQAVIQAKLGITAAANTGRFASRTDWIFVETKRIEQSLRDMGASEQELEEARSELVRLTLSDLGHSATGGSTVPHFLAIEGHQEWSLARRERKFADPDYVLSWLTKWDLLTSERQGLINDMRWVIEHRDVKDSAQYMRAHNPIEWQK
jgi:hypothetical protein